MLRHSILHFPPKTPERRYGNIEYFISSNGIRIHKLRHDWPHWSQSCNIGINTRGVNIRLTTTFLFSCIYKQFMFFFLPTKEPKEILYSFILFSLSSFILIFIFILKRRTACRNSSLSTSIPDICGIEREAE